MRGFFGIGLWNTKATHNLGTLWRSANSYDASFIFTIGARYKHQASDTLKTPRHVPLYSYVTFEEFYSNIPHDCQLIGVELDAESICIKDFSHPQRCIYLLGAEDHGLPENILKRCHQIVQLPGKWSLNVAVAGSIVMYDRVIRRVKEVGK